MCNTYSTRVLGYWRRNEVFNVSDFVGLRVTRVRPSAGLAGLCGDSLASEGKTELLYPSHGDRPQWRNL